MDVDGSILLSVDVDSIVVGDSMLAGDSIVVKFLIFWDPKELKVPLKFILINQHIFIHPLHCISLCTLFKSKKSSEWKWHTSLPSISICLHAREAKLDIVDKICQHPFSRSVP